MKKILSLTGAVALALTLSIAAFAGNPTQPATFRGANLTVNQNGINVWYDGGDAENAYAQGGPRGGHGSGWHQGGHGYNNGYGHGGYYNR